MSTLAKARQDRKSGSGSSTSRYRPPVNPKQTTLQTQLRRLGYEDLAKKQLSFLSDEGQERGDIPLWYAGELETLTARAVSVVGARDVSGEGAARARKVARQLAEAGIVVVSGLAAGVDTHALSSAIAAGGRVVAVIGTPLSKATPVGNAALQEDIYRKHLLVSQFPEGSFIGKSNFPERNRTMAALSAGTLIVEASDTSGTLHQAAECAKLGRWLFVMKSVMADETLTWPKKFAASKAADKMIVVESVEDITSRV